MMFHLVSNKYFKHFGHDSNFVDNFSNDMLYFEKVLILSAQWIKLLGK